MIERPSAADIRCPAEKVFDLIIDFRGQDRWLTGSASFHGTTEISSNPVALTHWLYAVNLNFLTADVGYALAISARPGSLADASLLLKTTDAGVHWTAVPITNQAQ